MLSELGTSDHRYIVKSVLHASAILELFQSPGEVLGLRDVVTRSGLTKGMCFRLLYTMHECGLLDRVGENQYRLKFPPVDIVSSGSVMPTKIKPPLSPGRFSTGLSAHARTRKSNLSWSTIAATLKPQ